RVGAVVAPGIGGERQRVAAAEDVLLRNRSVEDDTFVARIADAREQAPGVALGHRDVDIDLVRGARYRRRLDVDVVEVAEVLDPFLRALDPRTVVPRVLELAHLAADHHVTGFGIPADADPTHVRAPAGIDEERERRLRVLEVE